LAAEILRYVTDLKTFSLKENDLEKGWYVIFVQIILAYKKTTKKANEFCDANQILKKQDLWNLASKNPIWQP